MDLSFAEKAIFHQKDRFPEEKGTKMCNISIWCLCIIQNLTFFFWRLPVPNFSSCPLPFLFLGPVTFASFCVYSFWLP